MGKNILIIIIILISIIMMFSDSTGMDHNWVTTNVTSGLPPDAVIAGTDSDGDTIYVGKAYHNGDILPAKVIPNKNAAYVSWGGLEHAKHDIDVLTGQCYVWMPTRMGWVPPRALRVGKTVDGEPLYMGRAKWGDSMTPGKVQLSHNSLYIPYGGIEHRITDNYEVLVHPETWIAVTGGNVPSGAVEAGTDVDGDPIYVARAFHESELLPGKAIPNKGSAFVCYGGQEHAKGDYEVLVGFGYQWKSGSNGSIPENALACGHTSSGESLYIGRSGWGGSLTPGKVHPSHGCLYIPFGGQEIRLNDYEVLVYSEFN